MTSITLADSNIVIRAAIEIIGDGVVINGNNAVRIFHILASTTDNVTFSGLVLTNGTTATVGGGAIYAQQGATLRMTNCVVTACSATAAQPGGAIHNGGVLLETVDCQFVGNTAATANGSALSINVAPPEGLLAERCSFSGNSKTAPFPRTTPRTTAARSTPRLAGRASSTAHSQATAPTAPAATGEERST